MPSTGSPRVHYRFFKGFEAYVEGKNLTNSIARTYLNGNPLLPWSRVSRIAFSVRIPAGTGNWETGWWPPRRRWLGSRPRPSP